MSDKTISKGSRCWQGKSLGIDFLIISQTFEELVELIEECKEHSKSAVETNIIMFKMWIEGI